MSVCEELRERLSLAGRWQLAFDQEGEGVGGRWFAGGWPSTSEAVQVPGLWNLTHPDVEGVGFYRRTFAVPAAWSERVLRLHFGGASYRSQVWLNGVYLGSHEGAYTPFSFDVSPHIVAGAENELVVRVASLSKTRDVDGMVLPQSPASKQTWYYTHGGLWGDVYLESLPSTHCRSLRVEPDLAQEKVLVEATIDNCGQETQPLELQFEVTRPDGTVAAAEASQVVVQPGESCLSYYVSLPRPVPWECDNPYLYSLRVALSIDGQETDRQTVRFGMREFTVRDGQFLLNGEPIMLRGVLLQPNYPVTDIIPPTREMMVREITLMKEAGFNMIRSHIRPTPPGYLDLTDELGMLVYAECCQAWIKDSPRLLDHGRRELRALIERDRNHPSLVIWGINNENRAANDSNSDELTRLVRALDPTRVVLDNSGGTMAIDQDFGWADRATVIPSREVQRQPIQDLHIYIGTPLPGPVYEWLRTLGISPPPVDMAAHQFGSPAMLDKWSHGLKCYQGEIFVSELGCGGMADLDKVVAGFAGQEHLTDAREAKAFRDSLHQGFAARRMDGAFGSLPRFVRATQDLQAAGVVEQVEALLANPRVSGYCITSINDVAWEFHAGILDHWRNPKPVYHALKRLHRPYVVIVKPLEPNVACGEKVEVALTVVTQEPLRGEEVLRCTLRGPAGQEVELPSLRTPTGTGIRELGAVAVEIGPEPGVWEVQASLERGGEVLAGSSAAILAVAPVDLAPALAGLRWVGEAPAGLPTAAPGTGEGLLVAARPGALDASEWAALLDAVADGGVGIVGPLHQDDALALRLLAERDLPVKLSYGIGNWMGCYHWLRTAKLLPEARDMGLLGGGLAGGPYVDLLPWYVMDELGGELLAGSVRNTQTRFFDPAMIWYSDIEAVRLGRGTLVFCQYRLFERAATNPLAGRLFAEVMRLAGEYAGGQAALEGGEA